MLLYMCAGIVLVTWGVYLNVYVNILSTIICIAVVLLRKQKLKTIGLTLDRFIQGLIIGTICGVILSMVNIIPAIVSGGKWMGLSGLLWNFFFNIDFHAE